MRVPGVRERGACEAENPGHVPASSENRLSIHQHFFKAEFQEYALPLDYVDSGVDKFHADFLVGPKLLRTRKGQLKGLFGQQGRSQPQPVSQ
jgi:hypothetical protein